jgi:hypothetical protein
MRELHDDPDKTQPLDPDKTQPLDQDRTQPLPPDWGRWTVEDISEMPTAPLPDPDPDRTFPRGHLPSEEPTIASDRIGADGRAMPQPNEDPTVVPDRISTDRPAMPQPNEDPTVVSHQAEQPTEASPPANLTEYVLREGWFSPPDGPQIAITDGPPWPAKDR